MNLGGLGATTWGLDPWLPILPTLYFSSLYSYLCEMGGAFLAVYDFSQLVLCIVLVTLLHIATLTVISKQAHINEVSNIMLLLLVQSELLSTLTNCS